MTTLTENLPIEAIRLYGDFFTWIVVLALIMAAIGISYKVGVEQGWIK